MIVPARALDDDELLALSAANPGWHIERELDGSLSVAPTSYRDAIRSAEATRYATGLNPGCRPHY
jgi:hypothetical protein